MDDNALVAAMSLGVLSGGGERDDGRAAFQIAVTECECGGRGWVDGGGVVVDASPAVLEMAECDAVRIGNVDGDVPARAYQDISPAVRRAVLARDNHTCTVPGCTATRFLNLHHIEHRIVGGSHTPPNLTTICWGHHWAAHDGRVRIRGKAPSKLIFEWPVFDAIEVEASECSECDPNASYSQATSVVAIELQSHPHVELKQLPAVGDVHA